MKHKGIFGFEYLTVNNSRIFENSKIKISKILSETVKVWLTCTMNV